LVRLTCYGGVGEIGGNKFLLEDGDARIWLDMGAPFDFGADYLYEYLTPRRRFGLRDLFALDLMPRIEGLYAEAELEATDLPYAPSAFGGVLITHVHYDHTNHLRYLDPDVPVHLGEGAKTILDSWQATSRMRLGDHAYRTFRTGDTFAIDGVEVEPFHVDHSVPAAYGYLIHTSEGTVAYTGDLRQHGPRGEMTQEFVAAAKAAKPLALITEGTRVAPEERRQNFTEEEVRQHATRTVQDAPGRLVVATFYPRDVDRMRTFHEIARATDRRFVLSARAAHLLATLAADPGIRVPDVMGEADILVYFRELARPERWETDLRTRLGDRAVDAAYVHDHQGELILQLDFFHFTELIDLRPARGSPFIHSKSEPFEEDEPQEEVMRNWLDRFGLVHHQYHASGHLSRREVEEMIREIAPRYVVPVHTEHPDLFRTFARQTILPEKEKPLTLS
jgi:ribonuclease J